MQAGWAPRPVAQAGAWAWGVVEIELRGFRKGVLVSYGVFADSGDSGWHARLDPGKLRSGLPGPLEIELRGFRRGDLVTYGVFADSGGSGARAGLDRGSAADHYSCAAP